LAEKRAFGEGQQRQWSGHSLEELFGLDVVGGWIVGIWIGHEALGNCWKCAELTSIYLQLFGC
jgi:hypothetical protein